MEFTKEAKWFVWILVVLMMLILCCILYSQAEANETGNTVSISLPLPVQSTAAVWSGDEIACATRMVYGEARGSSFGGKVAVAAVAIQRAIDGRRYAMDLCAVVTQPRQFAGYKAHVRLRTALDRETYQQCQLAVLRALHWETLPHSYRGNYFFHAGREPRFAAWATLHGRMDGQTFYGLRA